MRRSSTAMVYMVLAALAAVSWAAGCNGLSSDCELTLTCPPAPAEPAPTCNGVFFSSACDACLKASCCAELGECDRDGFCMYYCVFGLLPSPPECAAGKTAELVGGLMQCMNTQCAAQCAPADQCNPVTREGCPPAFACELVFPGMFVCIEPPQSPSDICAACDGVNGPFCGPGLRCHEASKTCTRYCCTDADCGTGTCVLDPVTAFGGPLAIPEDKGGICVSAMGSGACDAPPVAPSNGTCFGGYPPK